MNRAVLWRACPHSRRIPEGWVISAPAQPLVHHVNSVRLRSCPTAGALEAIAERWQAGLGHRRVVIEDSGGDRVAGELEARGWSRERVVLMVLDPERSPAAAAAVDSRAREIDEACLRALEWRIAAREVGRPARRELLAQLSGAQVALRAATRCRRFAAADGGGEDLAATATLFCDPDVHGARVAQLESVAALPGHRERGLATAAVRAALSAGRTWGAARIVVAADADDWPQIWYARLGFAPVARHVIVRRDAE